MQSSTMSFFTLQPHRVVCFLSKLKRKANSKQALFLFRCLLVLSSICAGGLLLLSSGSIIISCFRTAVERIVCEGVFWLFVCSSSVAIGLNKMFASEDPTDPSYQKEASSLSNYQPALDADATRTRGVTPPLVSDVQASMQSDDLFEMVHDVTLPSSTKDSRDQEVWHVHICIQVHSPSSFDLYFSLLVWAGRASWHPRRAGADEQGATASSRKRKTPSHLIAVRAMLQEFCLGSGCCLRQWFIHFVCVQSHGSKRFSVSFHLHHCQ